MPGLIGPMMAALLVTALQDGRGGVRRLVESMVRWRVGVIGALIAVGTPLVLIAASAAAAALAGDAPGWRSFFVYPGIPPWGPLPVLAIALIANGLGEETGWRGFLLGQLERRWSPLQATLALAVLWAIWHWPLFLITDTFRNFGPGTLVGFFLGLACGAVVLTFVYHRTRDSVLMAAVWHVLYNLSSATAAAKGVAAAASTTVVMTAAAVLVVLEIRAARHGRSVLRPGPRDLGNPRPGPTL
jgi:membrane protease YdiL (CAAX protease family)